MNDGWRYNYGNQSYVRSVSQYLTDISPTRFDDETVQVVMGGALKYKGFPYVFGGTSPAASFDCSGLIQWVHDRAGISLPCIAQDQHDATRKTSMEEAQASGPIFFHSTYNADAYVTHVAVYLEGNRLYHAGDPIGYGNLNSHYWQDHLTGARRVIYS